MNTAAKDWLSRFLDRSGVLRFLERRQTPQAAIFALHRILPADEVAQSYNREIVLEKECFRAFLQWLANEWTVVSLEQLWEDPLPASSRVCALTFDDGWEDNYRIAFPLLQEVRLPATIFLPTAYIGTNNYMPEERLARLLARIDTAGEQSLFAERFTDAVGGAVSPELLSAGRYQSIFKKVPLQLKIRVLGMLEQQFGGSGNNGRHTITWDEARRMRAHGISFGSHTVNHCLLACEHENTIANELQTSRQVLRQQLGDALDALAYPNGSYDSRVVRLAAECGLKACVTTEYGVVRADTDRFRLPRIPIDTAVLSDEASQFSLARTRTYVLRASRFRKIGPEIHS